MSTIRKAARADLDAVCRIYDQIHTAEERGEARDVVTVYDSGLAQISARAANAAG